MKTVLLLLLSFWTAASNALTQKQNNLREIMQSVDSFPKEKAKDLWVAEAVTLKTCNHKNLCRAGKVLQEFKAEDFGLQEKEWKLHRLLLSYSQHENCTKPDNHTTVPLTQLLEEIHDCARKEFSRSAHRR